jgi:hypothetical protein
MKGPASAQHAYLVISLVLGLAVARAVELKDGSGGATRLVVELTDENFDNLTSSGPWMIDVYATWYVWGRACKRAGAPGNHALATMRPHTLAHIQVQPLPSVGAAVEPPCQGACTSRNPSESADRWGRRLLGQGHACAGSPFSCTMRVCNRSHPVETLMILGLRG